MPQTVTVTGGDGPDYELGRLPTGECGILTVTPAGAASQPGDPVTRGSVSNVFFPRRATNSSGSLAGYRYRPLRPGERVVFEGS